jgi:phage terminase small subunit
MDDLTEKQRRFVEAYVGPAKGNATEAARLAGYTGSGDTLKVTGHRTLTNANVARAIGEMNDIVRSNAIATAEEVQSILTSIARGQGTEPHVLQSGEVVQAEPGFMTRRAAAMDLAKLRGYVAPTKSEVDVTGAPAITVYLPSNGRDAPT